MSHIGLSLMWISHVLSMNESRFQGEGCHGAVRESYE